MLTGPAKQNYDIKHLADKEKFYLKADCPSLAYFRAASPESPFLKFPQKPPTDKSTPAHIRLISDKHSNLRALYYPLLVLAFDNTPPINSLLKSPERCDHLSHSLRASLLSDSLNL